MDITIESLRDGDEEQRHRLGREAFGGTAAFDPEAPRFDPDRIVAAYRGDELVGAVVTMAFAQCWSGGAIPCGGVSGVIVAPHARGQGLARAMLAESFDRMLRRGEVLSALYPTTASLYRSMGFEVAGWWRESTLAGSLLPMAAADTCTWRRGTVDDPDLVAVVDAMAPTQDGWLRHDPLWWQWRAARARAEPTLNRFVYLGEREGAAVAAVQFRQGSSDEGMFGLTTEVVAGRSGADVAAALGFLARHGTTAPRITTTLPPHLLATHTDHLQRITQKQQWPWMIRLVDVAGCLAARTVPAAVTGSVSLHVHDEVRPANAGPGIVHVHDGSARWEQGGPGQIEIAVTDLAAIFAGTDPRDLAAVGRLPGATSADLDLLRAAFVANPSAVDFF